jgi:hypothetical protein
MLPQAQLKAAERPQPVEIVASLDDSRASSDLQSSLRHPQTRPRWSP